MGRYRRAFQSAARAFAAQPFLPATRPLWLRLARFAASATTVVAALVAVVAPVLTFVVPTTTLDIPVQEFWPTLPSGAEVDGTQADYVSGGFDAATVTVTGLDLGARGWLALAQTSLALTVMVVAFTLMVLCSRILDDETPFARSVTRAVLVSGRAIIIGGIVTQIASGVASSLASQQLLRYSGAGWVSTIRDYDGVETILGFPSPAWYAGFDYWPIVIGVILLVLGAAFRYGERLQQRTATLERDSRGLV